MIAARIRAATSPAPSPTAAVSRSSALKMRSAARRAVSPVCAAPASGVAAPLRRIPAPLRLLAERAALHEALLAVRRAEARLGVELHEERVRHCEVDVIADEIHQLKRAHPEPRRFHDAVNLLVAG